MAYVQAWTPEETQKQLVKRLKRAKKKREALEAQWRRNERTVFFENGRSDYESTTISEDGLLAPESGMTGEPDGSELCINFAFKFQRFIHAQLSSNPPSVMVRPTSTDNGDRLKADGADRLVRHGYHDMDAQELFDIVTLKSQTYGNGWVKEFWDPNAGDAHEFEEDGEGGGNLTMAGNICAYSPSTWNVWVDPDAKSWREVRYVFERIEMPYEEACFRWPENKDKLEQAPRILLSS
jgi:hypothetical protein